MLGRFWHISKIIFKNPIYLIQSAKYFFSTNSFFLTFIQSSINKELSSQIYVSIATQYSKWIFCTPLLKYNRTITTAKFVFQIRNLSIIFTVNFFINLLKLSGFGSIQFRWASKRYWFRHSQVLSSALCHCLSRICHRTYNNLPLNFYLAMNF